MVDPDVAASRFMRQDITYIQPYLSLITVSKSATIILTEVLSQRALVASAICMAAIFLGMALVTWWWTNHHHGSLDAVSRGEVERASPPPALPYAMNVVRAYLFGIASLAAVWILFSSKVISIGNDTALLFIFGLTIVIGGVGVFLYQEPTKPQNLHHTTVMLTEGWNDRKGTPSLITN